MSEAARSGLDPCPYCGHEHADTVLKCPKTDMLLELSGRILDDKFRFVRRLGRGGMASVWLAINTRVDRQVAIKIIRPEVLRHDSLVARFRSEAKAAGRIGDPGVCEILDYGIGPVGPYIVMEHLQGRNLGQVLKAEGPMPTVRAIGIVRQALAGLAAAHKRGIVHRDLKPENVFLHRAPNGHVVVKLMDFGVAKFIDGSSEIETEHGALLGTPEYMAPEQFAGASQAEPRTDLWAMGAILYRALTGRHAFKGPTVAATLMKVTHEEPAPPRSLRADIPESVQRVILRCLSKSVDDRYPTAEALDAALHEIALELGADHAAPALGSEDVADAASSIVIGAAESSSPPDPSLPHSLLASNRSATSSLSSVASPNPTELATPRSASVARSGAGARPGTSSSGVAASALPRPDVELPDPELTPIPPDSSGAATLQVVPAARRSWTAWAIAGAVMAVALSVFAAKLRGTSEQTAEQSADRAADRAADIDRAALATKTHSVEAPLHERDVEAAPSSNEELIETPQAPSDPVDHDEPVVDPEPIEDPPPLLPADGEPPVHDPSEPPAESGGTPPPDPDEPVPSVPPAPSEAGLAPAGTVVVGDHVVLLEPGPRGDHGGARKYCEALAMTAKLGLRTWSLPNPSTANEIASTPEVPRGRFWTSARWKNRVRVLHLPSGRLVSTAADRKFPRALCVAEWPARP